MCLIPIDVPIFVRDGRAFIGTARTRSPELLRDSFGGGFGPLVALDGWTAGMVEQHRFGARPAAVAP